MHLARSERTQRQTSAAVRVASVSTSPRFTLRLEGDRALIYDRGPHQYYPLSAAEAFLLSTSGQVGLDRSEALVAQRLGKKEAKTARRRLLADGMLTPAGFFGRIVEHRAVPGAFAAPLICHLGLTLACNFACNHCYSSSGQRGKNELTFDEIQRLVEQLAAIGCVKLVLGGGEPFLRRELPEIVAYADSQGVDCFIHTNASLLDGSLLERLARCPPAGLAVSIDGPDARTNDQVRGPGSFSKTMAGLRILRERWPHGFNLSMTVTPTNAHLTPRVVDLARAEGAWVLLLRPAYPAGVAMKNPALSCDLDSFVKAVELARKRARRVGLALDAPHPLDSEPPDFEGFGCVAARVVLGVDPKGNVTPCLNLPATFDSGNVKSHTVLELWRTGRGFEQLRAQEPGPQCSTCKHYESCRGGCRVRSLYSGNGLSGPDSWCHYEPREEQPAPRRKVRAALRR